MSDAFIRGFADELEKIAVDWSTLAPTLVGAGLGGAGGYYGSKALGAGKKGRIAGAALGAAGGGALGAVGGAGARAVMQPGATLESVTRAIGRQAPKAFLAPVVVPGAALYHGAKAGGKAVYHGGKGLIEGLGEFGKEVTDKVPKVDLGLGGRAAGLARAAKRGGVSKAIGAAVGKAAPSKIPQAADLLRHLEHAQGAMTGPPVPTSLLASQGAGGVQKAIDLARAKARMVKDQTSAGAAAQTVRDVAGPAWPLF